MPMNAQDLIESTSVISSIPGDTQAAEARLRRLAERHAQRVGPESPTAIVSAPGRTELAGNHTDHNNGRVLCASVDLDVLAVVSPRSDSLVRIESEGYEEEIKVDVSSTAPRPEERERPHALIRGVAAAFAEAGRAVTGFDATVTSNVASGSGLSSSAAFEVLLGTTLVFLPGMGDAPGTQELSRDDVLFVARAGRRAENEFFGKPCGLMDQIACAHGGIISIDFSLEPPEITPVAFDFSTAGYALAVVDTGGSHADLTADYAAVPEEMRAVASELGGEVLADCEEDSLYARLAAIRRKCGDRAVLRALHFFSENRRVSLMIEALAEGNAETYLRLVRESGESSGMLLQNYYPPHAPEEQGIGIGTTMARHFLDVRDLQGAARVHGGGFAGTIQVYIPIGQWQNFVSAMEEIFGAGSVTRLRVRADAPRFIVP